MGSGNLSEKRRRAEHSSSALSKPFKSPLRRPLQTSEIKEVKKDASPTIENRNSSPSSTHQADKAPPAGTEQPQPNTSTTIPSLPSINSPPSSITSSPLSSQTRKRKALTGINRLTPSKRPIVMDPETAALQKQQRALQSRLSALRSELDTARQALRVESSDKDTELEALIAKWKSVSQSAAEEVFAGAQERVSRMGGMKAWREQMRSQSARWEEEEMSSWYGSAEAEGFGNVDAEEVEARRAEMLEEWGGDGRGKGEGVEKKREEGVEDEEFTMEFMLKTLNVDLNLIGYDREGQRWVKD